MKRTTHALRVTSILLAGIVLAGCTSKGSAVNMTPQQAKESTQAIERERFWALSPHRTLSTRARTHLASSSRALRKAQSAGQVERTPTSRMARTSLAFSNSSGRTLLVALGLVPRFGQMDRIRSSILPTQMGRYGLLDP